MSISRWVGFGIALALAGCGGGDATAPGTMPTMPSDVALAGQVGSAAGTSGSAAPVPVTATSPATAPAAGSIAPGTVATSTPTAPAGSSPAVLAPAVALPTASAPAATVSSATPAASTPVVASAPAASGAFSFNLAAAARTSAGVYLADGTLVRTLWSGEPFAAGTHTRLWDGLLDDGTAAPRDRAHTIKVLSGNVRYEWEGARIGNTSTALTGATKHRLFEPMRGLAIWGGTAYVAGGYSEAWPAQYKFSLATPQEKRWVGALGATDLGTDFVATDGVNVYWAGYDPLEPKVKNGHETLVFATRVSDDQPVAFGSNGTPASMEWGHTYPSTISYLRTGLDGSPIISGLAVQKSRPYLFVARSGLDQVQVLNKTTGAVAQVLTLPTPAAMVVDAADNLWLSHGATVTKYTVAANGALTPAGPVLAGLSRVGALAVSPDGSVLLVADMASQQVKAYSTATLTLLWTLGRSGGYLADATVTDDKFYFRDVNGDLRTYLAYAPDGTFWVGDPGNFRTLHFSASRSVMETLMIMPSAYTTMLDANNPTRLFAGYQEFAIDYSKPMGANNGSWRLKKNWGANVDHAIFNSGERMQFITTMSNGRTYARLRSAPASSYRGVYPVVELVEGGTIRFTGIEFPQRTFITKDGARAWNPGARLNTPFQVITYPLTGFDAAHNPMWASTPDSITATPPLAGTDPVPWEGFRTEMFTTSGHVIYFDYTREEFGHGTGWHLGAMRKGGSQWLWRTAPSRGKGYSGPMPEDGAFDVGNGVVYPGGSAVISGDQIFWGYHGEFWKQSQTNIWNHVDARTGLFVSQFGVQNTDFPGAEAPPGGAGNVKMGSIATVDGVTYLYHGDEGINNGLHRWRITGLDTIKVQQAVFPSSLAPYIEPGVDLMAGLPRGTSLVNNTAGWTRNPATDITTNPGSDYFVVATGVKTADRFKPTDVYALFRQTAADFSVSRDLGTQADLASWRIKGRIGFEGTTPTPPELRAGGFLEVLDDAGKLLARLDVRRNRTSGTDIVTNDKVLANETAETMRTVFNRLQPFEISVTAGVYTFSYAGYPAITTTVQPEPGGNWRNPRQLRMNFFTHNAGDNYYRTMDLSELRFVAVGR